MVAMGAASTLGSLALRADEGGAAGRAARLSSAEGQVQIVQGGEALADRALVNTPLFEGMQIATGDDGQAEIQFDDGSIARIPPDSSVTLTALKAGGETEVSLDSGMAYFELQGSQSTPMRVRFGGSVVTGSGFTVLRIKLDDGPGEMAVFSGTAHVDGTNGTSMDVHGGQSVGLTDLNVAESIEPYSWDAWNSDRDQALSSVDEGSTAATSNLANPNNPAWGDLNSGGTWYDVPDQGYVWSPYEASNQGWDPWSEGYWMWNPRFGYMWVSTYSWGYMPYQCGIWNWYGGFGWGWAPQNCSPWWGVGGGWAFNVGTMPPWYRLPLRPRPIRPLNPRPMQPGGRLHVGLRPVAPVIPVNRKQLSGTTPLPPREPNHPVQMGDVTARPLRPVAPRAVGGPAMGFTHGTPVSAGPTSGVSQRTGTTITPRPVYTPADRTYMPAPGYGSSRPGYMPAPQPGGGRVTGGPAPRTGVGGTYRPPSAPRPSGGGGSHPAPSGGSHPSGGGGSHGSSGGSSHK